MLLLQFFSVFHSASFQAHHFLTSIYVLFSENRDIDINNFLEDITPYFLSFPVVSKTQEDTKIIFRWFPNNNLISNAERSPLIVNSKKILEVKVSSSSIKSEEDVKSLSVIPIPKNMNISQRTILPHYHKRKLLPQFSYYPLILLFHSETMKM